MAFMGNYKELLQSFLKNKKHVKKEDLKPITIYGLPKGLEEEFQHSYLTKVAGSLSKITGIILAYDVDEDKKSFKYLNKDGNIIGITIRPDSGNGEIGISEDGIEKIWSCHKNNTGDIELSPVALRLEGNPISINRKFAKGKANITAYDRNSSLSIKLEDKNNGEEFYILPYENELICQLMGLTSLSETSLNETYNCIKDITGLNLNCLGVSIKTTRDIGPNEGVLSRLIIDKGENPAVSIGLAAPNNERIIYTITDTENGHVNVAIETICGTGNTTVTKPIKSSLSIMELHEFLIEIIKRGKAKRRD